MCRLDVVFLVKNIAQTPAEPVPTAIRNGFHCVVGPFVIPVKTTESIGAGGTARKPCQNGIAKRTKREVAVIAV